MQKIKSLVFNIYFVLASSFSAIFGLIFLLGNRKMAFKTPQLWGALNSWGARHILGLDYRVLGLENMPEGPCIIASKHQSAWETYSFCNIFPESVFIAKRELLYIPFFNFHFMKTKTIMLNRKLGSHAKADMVRQAQERIADGDRIIIYPEGTRKGFGEKPKYKQGIAAMYTELNVPVVPVALDSGAFWPRRGFEKKSGTITVSILPPIQPGLPHAEFMKNLEDKIEGEMLRLSQSA
jgi:1-acyl-sn-glycerol-3-phosphate acyltransferase